MTLFDPGPPTVIPRETLAALSADRRRTIQQQSLLRMHIHPATARALLPKNRGVTCGDCVHNVVVHHNSRRYHKCDTRPITRGAGTDLRVSWPACVLFSPVDP